MPEFFDFFVLNKIMQFSIIEVVFEVISNNPWKGRGGTDIFWYSWSYMPLVKFSILGSCNSEKINYGDSKYMSSNLSR